MGSERWDVGDPIGLGNDIGAPEVPYMNYHTVIIEDEEEKRRMQEEEEKERKNAESKYRSDRLSYEAWKLYDEKRYGEALVFIRRALEYCDREANTWNRKALILEKLNEYEEALSDYDTAIGISSLETFKHNKAVCLIDYCYILKDSGEDRESLDKINDALEIFQKITDKRYEDEAWNLKGIFLERLDDIPEAFNCYKKALELADTDSKMKQTYRENRDNLLPLIDDSGIVCPNCGNELKITDNACFRCGAHIGEPIKPTLRNQPDPAEESEMDREYAVGATILHFDDE